MVCMQDDAPSSPEEHESSELKIEEPRVEERSVNLRAQLRCARVFKGEDVLDIQL